jgi:hypothetical protein
MNVYSLIYKTESSKLAIADIPQAGDIKYPYFRERQGLTCPVRFFGFFDVKA